MIPCRRRRRDWLSCLPGEQSRQAARPLGAEQGATYLWAHACRAAEQPSAPGLQPSAGGCCTYAVKRTAGIARCAGPCTGGSMQACHPHCCSCGPENWPARRLHAGPTSCLATRVRHFTQGESAAPRSRVCAEKRLEQAKGHAAHRAAGAFICFLARLAQPGMPLRAGAAICTAAAAAAAAA